MGEGWATDGSERLFFVESGQGIPLVFLHGGLTDHRAVLPMVEPLSDRFRVVTPDLRGSGRSVHSGSLAFDLLTEDLDRLLDHLGIEAAFIGGVSSGTGAALHFALTRPGRTLGLVLVHPVYAGSADGYTPGQVEAFAGMDAIASRAGTEGIEVLREMYFSRLPEPVAERAWSIASGFDPGSVVATSRFIASGVQPFDRVEDLASVGVPTMLVPGNDDVHPPSISSAYARSIPECVVPPSNETDVTGVIRSFLERNAAS